jgi:hypothetical protein
MKENEDIFGVIFKKDEEIFVSEYCGYGKFSDGYPITNKKPYKELKQNQLSLAFIKKAHHEWGNSYNIRDLMTVTIENENENIICKACEMLKTKEVKQNISDFFENIIKQSLEENNG